MEIIDLSSDLAYPPEICIAKQLVVEHV